MARSQINFTITDPGRDMGKTFVLTEMSAAQCESWAMRALLALMGSGVTVPEGFERMGVAGIAQLGLKALSGLKWEIVEPLFAEMFECIKFMPDASRPQITRPVMDEDIEEVKTRLTLRVEVWKMHTDFLKAVGPSIASAAATQAAR